MRLPALLAALLPLAAGAAFATLAAPAWAQPIANPIATFAGLDKITGRITRFDVYIDETVLFGALELTRSNDAESRLATTLALLYRDADVERLVRAERDARAAA